MKLTRIDPPREFEVGHDVKIRLKDCAHIELQPDEQVTFTASSGAEYDVARKAWGFYATPSLNGRLQRFGLRGVLVKNRHGQYFFLLVQKGEEEGFERYRQSEKLDVVCWMDNSAALDDLNRKVGGQPG